MIVLTSINSTYNNPDWRNAGFPKNCVKVWKSFWEDECSIVNFGLCVSRDQIYANGNIKDTPEGNWSFNDVWRLIHLIPFTTFFSQAPDVKNKYS